MVKWPLFQSEEGGFNIFLGGTKDFSSSYAMYKAMKLDLRSVMIEELLERDSPPEHLRQWNLPMLRVEVLGPTGLIFSRRT